MAARADTATRDRAILVVRLATAAAVALAVGFAWLFSNLAEAFFSGKPPAVPPPPQVPVAKAPAQTPRTVVQTVVHHPYNSRPGSGANAPRPPSSGPAAAPPPAPPPACHSTPTKPC